MNLNKEEILNQAKEILSIEAKSIYEVIARLDESFYKAVEILFNCKGKVILTGMGKSGIIARKIASTMSSTGTLAVFLHPAEGLHGELGIVTDRDVIIAIGKSGESEELLGLLPIVHKIGAPIIAIVGNVKSTLAKNADVVIDASVEREACPLNLAPTASTTVALAIGDALAGVLLKLRGFKVKDFAFYHPSGSLGKRLLLKVSDLMHSGDENPLVLADTQIKDVLIVMTSKAMGGVNVVDEKGKLIGLITDGDMRRSIQKYENLLSLTAKDIMTRNPITITPETMAYDALVLMENRPSQISVLPVVDSQGRAIGILRLHDLVRVGF